MMHDVTVMDDWYWWLDRHRDTHDWDMWWPWYVMNEIYYGWDILRLRYDIYVMLYVYAMMFC